MFINFSFFSKFSHRLCVVNTLNIAPSVLRHCWSGHLIRKNPSPIWPIMCLVRH